MGDKLHGILVAYVMELTNPHIQMVIQWKIMGISWNTKRYNGINMDE